jgi:hypothetical protein
MGSDMSYLKIVLLHLPGINEENGRRIGRLANLWLGL